MLVRTHSGGSVLSHFQLALMLGMTVALGPLALDAYLPAFPIMARNLGVAHADIGLSLGAYVLTLGLAQLVGGPLSDRYGRRLILFTGLAVFATAAGVIAQADSLKELVAWRLVQGIGGAFCAVSVPAIVRDQSSGQDAARLFGLIGLIMFVAPAAAPWIGTLMLVLGDWHWIFLALAGYAILLAGVLQWALFPRLAARPAITTPVSTLVTNYLIVLRHATTLRFIGIQVLCFSILMLFITHSSFIYQEWYGLANSTFSLLFAGNIVVMAAINLINRRLLLKVASVRLLRAEVALQWAALVTLVTVVSFNGPLWALVACIFLAIGCQGGIIPNNMANALEFFPHLGGTASALLGAAQFTLAGAISALSATFAGDALVPIALSMLACSCGALVLALGAARALARAKAVAS